MSYLDRDSLGIYKNRSHQGPGPELMGADTLLGEEVRNLSDDHVGDIKEFMLEMRTGRVAYAVLSFGGVFTVGEKLFAVPWNALKLDTENKCFLLDVSKEHLKNAPGFDPNHWPDMGDPSWAGEIESYYRTANR